MAVNCCDLIVAMREKKSKKGPSKKLSWKTMTSV